ncbi:MAG: DUF3747 domain-containing protein [Prochlorococcus sp. MED-G132]|nr:MAG: DUF3747 domain-containing protein [Prochlorococcus sp. MED-G132]
MARYFPSAVALVLVGATGLTGWSSSVQAQGSLFTAAPVEQSRFILVGAPIGKGERSQLNIYEQRSSKRACFAVDGSLPAVVDPLLARFDFTGICNRYIDGNGYSLRIGGDDLGTHYRLSVVRTDGDMHLLAIPTRDTSSPALIVARAGGAGVSSSDFLKLNFEPGWQLMRRQYGQRTLGHLYVFSETWPGSSDEDVTAEEVVVEEEVDVEEIVVEEETVEEITPETSTVESLDR